MLAVSASRTHVTIDNMIIKNGNFNGRIMELQSLRATISRLTVEVSTSYHVLYFEDTIISMEDSTIGQNEVYNDCVSLYISSLTLRNITFVGNLVHGEMYSLIQMRFSQLEIRESLFENNNAGLSSILALEYTVAINQTTFRSVDSIEFHCSDILSYSNNTAILA